jgi:hypothetical protein
MRAFRELNIQTWYDLCPLQISYTDLRCFIFIAIETESKYNFHGRIWNGDRMVIPRCNWSPVHSETYNGCFVHDCTTKSNYISRYSNSSCHRRLHTSCLESLFNLQFHCEWMFSSEVLYQVGDIPYSPTWFSTSPHPPLKIWAKHNSVKTCGCALSPTFTDTCTCLTQIIPNRLSRIPPRNFIRPICDFRFVIHMRSVTPAVTCSRCFAKLLPLSGEHSGFIWRGRLFKDQKTVH